MALCARMIPPDGKLIVTSEHVGESYNLREVSINKWFAPREMCLWMLTSGIQICGLCRWARHRATWSPIWLGVAKCVSERLHQKEVKRKRRVANSSRKIAVSGLTLWQ
jgi:hypothetical protein